LVHKALKDHKVPKEQQEMTELLVLKDYKE
jgi:hypothetical protein